VLLSKLAEQIQAARAHFSVGEGGDRSEHMPPLMVNFSLRRLEYGVIEIERPKIMKEHFYS
jgi:hypothetical protein